MAKGAPVFQEDFFQRISNVQWPHEPECYWWAGLGTGIVGLQPALQNQGLNWTSEDGKSWNGGSSGEGGQAGAPISYSMGLYFRQNFTKDGKPTWLMAGQDGLLHATAWTSHDGGYSWAESILEDKSFNTDVYFMHFNHQGEIVIIVSQFNTFSGAIWKSRDGYGWQRTPASGWIGGLLGSYPTFGWPGDRKDGKVVISQDGNDGHAVGRTRGGPVISLKATNFNEHNHIDPITVTTADGESWSLTTGLSRIQHIVYGHYVFVICGSEGDVPGLFGNLVGGHGKILWTEDGRTVNSGVANAGDGIIWPCACGPRGVDKMFPSGGGPT